MSGKLDCQLVIEMIGRTWDRQFATYASQPDGPLKGAGGYIDMGIYVHIWIYMDISTGCAQPCHRAYNLWVAVWWYCLVVYDFGRTGFVNGTIRCAYFKHYFHPQTSIPGSLGVIVALLSSILVALGSPP